jgi:hypothetical protein
MAVAETSSNEQDVRSMALYFTRLKSSSNASQDSCESVSWRKLRTSVRTVVAGLSRLMASRCSIIDVIGAVLCFSHERLYRLESSLELEMGTANQFG